MRALDEPIPPKEELYRGARDSDVVGDVVNLAIVDSLGTSCNRQKYAAADSVLEPDKGRTRVVVTTPDALPGPVIVNEIEYEFFAVDAPEEGRDAHSEIRWRRTDKRPSSDHANIKSSTTKLALKALLARAFRVKAT